MAYLALRIIAASLAIRASAAFHHVPGAGRTGARKVCTLAAAGTALPEGVAKTVTSAGLRGGRIVQAGDIVSVKYACSVAAAAGSTENLPAFARSERQRVVVGDGSMIVGWEAAVRTMTEGERASVRISNPKFGYGATGVPPFVPANAEIDIDIEVLGIEESAGFGERARMVAGSGEIGMDGPVSRPRTPGAIAAAYEKRMQEKTMNEPEKREGIEGIIDDVKGWYIFGLFEGETGQEAPWYLKPSITFPLAFLVVGAAFGVSILGGAISERGMPTKDDLDEIIISSVPFRTNLVLALSMLTDV